MIIAIDKIAISDSKVYRIWEEQPDGSLLWRKRADVIWKIEQHNSWIRPDIPRSHRPMISCDGVPFFPYEQSVTLDDFVLLRDIWKYCHIRTGLKFNARQINKQIFRDTANWPTRLGEIRRPSAWLHKYNRIEDSRRFNIVRGALHVAA